MSNKWDEAKFTQYLIKVVLWPPKQVQPMWGRPRDLVGFTHTLRTVPEPMPLPAGMGQERAWTCHSELVTRDALMQHQFWARMKLAQRSQEVWGEETSCLNTPTISKCTTPDRATSLPSLPFISGLSCLLSNENGGHLGPTLPISTAAHGSWNRVFSWESTTLFFLSFELVLTILKSVGFMNGIMN